jgi:hypothetical protein
MARTTDMTATVRRLEAALARERAERLKVVQRLGGMTSMNRRLRALVLSYRAREAAARAKRAVKAEAHPET